MRAIPEVALNAITNRICEIADLEHPGETGMVTVLMEDQEAAISWIGVTDISDLLALLPDEFRKTALDYFDAPPVSGRVLVYFLDVEDNSYSLGYVDYKAVDTGREQDYSN